MKRETEAQRLILTRVTPPVLLWIRTSLKRWRPALFTPLAVLSHLAIQWQKVLDQWEVASEVRVVNRYIGQNTTSALHSVPSDVKPPELGTLSFPLFDSLIIRSRKFSSFTPYCSGDSLLFKTPSSSLGLLSDLKQFLLTSKYLEARLFAGSRRHQRSQDPKNSGGFGQRHCWAHA